MVSNGDSESSDSPRTGAAPVAIQQNGGERIDAEAKPVGN